MRNKPNPNLRIQDLPLIPEPERSRLLRILSPKKKKVVKTVPKKKKKAITVSQKEKRLIEKRKDILHKTIADGKYLLVYNDYVNTHKLNEKKGHKHHIMPKCLLGSDTKSNIAFLTAEHHIEAHRLLTLTYPTHHGLKSGYRFLKNRFKSSTLTS